ncbi:MAG: ABC transporter substrate-binding protein [Chloroflexota bacterium]
MKQVRKVLKTGGKVLLAIALVLALLAAGFFVWLRSEPAEVTECDLGFRFFEHAYGVSCVPENPENILVYSTAASQMMVAIGKPMAMQETALDEWASADIPGLYDRLKEVNKDVLDLGRVGGTVASNAELLLNIQPDLIISEWLVSEDLARTASLVAPTVLLSDNRNWKEVTLTAGDVIGEKEQVDALVAAYEVRVQILREQFDDPANISIATVRLWPGNPFIMLEESFAGQIVRDVGFSAPESQSDLSESETDGFLFRYNEERIDLIDADFIILFPALGETSLRESGSDSKTLAQEFQNDPLFLFLEAAESGNVFAVDAHWHITGIYSAHYVLDDLFRHVAGIDPEEVAPNPLRLQ